MAFEETLARIEELRRNLEATESGVLQARDARDKLTDDITNARRRLERKRNSSTFPNRVAGQITRELKKEKILTGILIASIDAAIESQNNNEFELGEYKAALHNVANRQDIYRIIPYGDGWNLSITPLISFEEEAGDLTDWATGIEAYRAVLGTKIDADEDSDRGARATEWWLSNVYGSRKEAMTVRQRISLSGKRAPFWQILQNGTQPLASDRPDSAYNPLPPVTPTDFIGDAEEAIRVIFMQYFNTQRDQWFEEASQLELEIEDAVRVRDSFTEDIRQLTPDVRLNRRIMDSLGKKKQYADERKLAQAIKKYRAGENFETSHIELTLPGMKGKNRVRLSLSQFEGYMDDL